MPCPLIHRLIEGDMRTIGASNAIVSEALQDTAMLSDLVGALEYPHPGVRMRAADALEKISHTDAGLLQPFKSTLLQTGEKSDQQEVQWHMALLLPRLVLSVEEADEVEKLLIRYGETTRSAIVRANSIEGITRIALQFPERNERAVAAITDLMRIGSASAAARGKKMLARLGVKA